MGFNAGFPHGFLPLRDAAALYHSAVGVWLSPFGGYCEPKRCGCKYGRPQGFEINSRGFAMAGPKYYARFRDVCRQMIEKSGVNYFKFDGIAAGLEYDKLNAGRPGRHRRADAAVRGIAGRCGRTCI